MDYARAVQVLRDSGASVHLVVKRRIVLPLSSEPQTLKVTLTKNKKKDGEFRYTLEFIFYSRGIVQKSLFVYIVFCFDQNILYIFFLDIN